MNRRLILRLQGASLILEAVLMLPALCIALYYQDGDALAFCQSMGILLLFGLPVFLIFKPSNRSLRPREGLVSVGLSWILLSIFGALPFFLSGAIPNFSDALFESISGFSTTGATLMQSLETQPHGILFWRSFTLWIGGMGVLVLTLALLPQMTDRSSFLIRAESPGPGLSKMVPRMGDMAKILYLIYIALTIVQAVAFVLAGMSAYDAVIHSMGIAGTGGFSNYSASLGHFQSRWIEGISFGFMVLFGINFALFYRILRGSWKDALKSEEFRWFLGILTISILLISLLVLPQYQSFGAALRHSAFHSASIISTTGYTTQNLNEWHQGAKSLLLLMMFLGSCGGSTAGGLKIIRLLILGKAAKREIQHIYRPRKIQALRLDGKPLDDNLIYQTLIFFFLFVALTLIGTLIFSMDNLFNFEVNFTTALACIGNAGAGFGMANPATYFSLYSLPSKITMMVLMLLGRLEIFPLLVLLHPSVWRK